VTNVRRLLWHLALAAPTPKPPNTDAQPETDNAEQPKCCQKPDCPRNNGGAGGCACRQVNEKR
jgi:hypothetical protein